MTRAQNEMVDQLVREFHNEMEVKKVLSQEILLIVAADRIAADHMQTHSVFASPEKVSSSLRLRLRRVWKAFRRLRSRLGREQMPPSVIDGVYVVSEDGTLCDAECDQPGKE